MFSLNMQMGFGSGGSSSYVIEGGRTRHTMRPEVSSRDIAKTYHPIVSGTHWVSYKIHGKGDDPQLIRDEMAKMVNMLRETGIPKILHLTLVHESHALLNRRAGLREAPRVQSLGALRNPARPDR